MKILIQKNKNHKKTKLHYHKQYIKHDLQAIKQQTELLKFINFWTMPYKYKLDLQQTDFTHIKFRCKND